MGTNLQQHLVAKEWQHDGKRPGLGILIETRTSDEYWSLRAHFIRFDPEDSKPRNLSSGRQPLADVIIGGQADRVPADYVRDEGDEGRIYAFDLRVETGGGSLTLTDLKHTVSALSIIDRRITALSHEGYEPGEGGWSTFREWFPLLVKACGIAPDYIVVHDGEPHGWYSDSTFRPVSVEQAIFIIEDSAKGAVK